MRETEVISRLNYSFMYAALFSLAPTIPLIIPLPILRRFSAIACLKRSRNMSSRDFCTSLSLAAVLG